VSNPIDPTPPARRRPASVLVLAILHLVGGGISFLLSLCCGVAALLLILNPNAVGSTPEVKIGVDLVRYLEQNLPSFRVVNIITLAVGLGLDLVLILAGVGLLRLRPWARKASLVYAPLSIVLRLFSFFYAFLLVEPVQREYFQGLAARTPALSSGQFGQGLVLYLSLLFLTYPVVVMWILTRPTIKAAFEGEASS
jgi:hypothetical protein